MSIYKFDREDVIRSVVKSYPQISFKMYSGYIYTNIKDTETFKFSPTIIACDIEGLDFSCTDNSEYIGVI
jgi:hypothetical protein